MRKISLKSVTRFVKDEKGQGLVEYALILVLVSITCIAVLKILGSDLVNVFNAVAGNLNSVSGA